MSSFREHTSFNSKRGLITLVPLLMISSSFCFAKDPSPAKPKSALGGVTVGEISSGKKNTADASCWDPKKGSNLAPAKTPSVPTQEKDNALDCADGIAYGRRTDEPVTKKYNVNGEIKTAAGFVHEGPYIPYKGAFNTFYLDETNQYKLKDRRFAMLNNPVETLGEVVPLSRPNRPELKFVKGKISHFGGSGDTGVTVTETSAGTGTRSRNLNTKGKRYCTMRFDLTVAGNDFWNQKEFVVYNPKTGLATKCAREDWGPSKGTGRIIDASQLTLKLIGATTDDEVYVSFAKKGCCVKGLDC